MEKITAFLEGIDLTKLVPEMDTLLDKLQLAASIAVMVGPLVMLVLGLCYLFLPPKEANHRAGFRTYFGMGSVEAWRFTQKIAGIGWGVMGLVLSIIMGITCAGFKTRPVMEVAESAARCLVWQAVLALAVYVAICLAATIFFDRKGNRRFNKK